MIYRFSFRGQLNEDAKAEKVQKNLARLFAVEVSELDGLFDGRLEFVRDGLDHTAAQSYLAQFKRAGALGKVEPQNSEPSEDALGTPNKPAEDTDAPLAFEPQEQNQNTAADDGSEPTADGGNADELELDSSAQYGSHVLAQIESNKRN